MPEFCNINSIFEPSKKMTKTEMIRAIKFALSSEFEALQIYQEIIESTDNNDVKKVLTEIGDDERRHAGGLHKLLMILSPEDAKAYEDGAKETMEDIGK